MSHLQSDPYVDAGRCSNEVEALLRLRRRLDENLDLDQLLRFLPEELRNLVDAEQTGLIYFSDGGASRYTESVGRGIATDVAIQDLQFEEMHRHLADDSQAAFFFLTDRTIGPFSWLLRETDGKSTCVLVLKTALRCLGALYVARASRDDYSEEEINFLTLIAHNVTLALDNRLNRDHAESVRAQLELERTKLKLLFDLNNSAVSTFKLREVLRSISQSIRNATRVDGVAVMLPGASGSLELCQLDCVDGNCAVPPDMSVSMNGSVAEKVYRTAQPWVGNVEDLRASGRGGDIFSPIKAKALCFLPFIRCNRTLGVLCLLRIRREVFTQQEIEFLMQVSGQVAITIDNALAYRRITELSDKLTQEKLYLEDEIRNELNFDEIIGNSQVLRQVLLRVEAVAPTNSTVLIQGETGSGKELIARAVHNRSHRRSHPFIKLNCAAIPTGLLESELFGHEKGAFTGAITQRIGRFEVASEGTIFLDEISEIPLELQPKLLRVLQEREFERLGSSRTLRTESRLIAATNRDLEAMVSEQHFRSDLFYRLNVFPIHVPPLRERPEDIPFLVRHFAQHFARNMSKTIATISTETMNALVSYPWPGNIRELQNIIERAVILSKNSELRIPQSDLKSKNTEGNGHSNGLATLEEVERRHILSVLDQTNWVFAGPKGAAARLGIKRPTLQFRMQKLGIKRPSKT